MEPPRLLEGGLFTPRISSPARTRREVRAAHGAVTHLVLPYERKLMQAEQEACRLLALHEIPTSRVVACDTSRRVIDRDYMMVEYISSVPILDDSVPEGKKTVCMNRLADMPLKCTKSPARRSGAWRT